MDQAPAPVLLPPADSPYFGGALVVRTAFWAYSVHVPDAVFSVQASTRARLYPRMEVRRPTDRIRGVPAWFTRNEGIASVSWIEHGVAYTAELECTPPDAPRCAGDGQLRSIVEGLVYVGGGKGPVP